MPTATPTDSSPAKRAPSPAAERREAARRAHEHRFNLASTYGGRDLRYGVKVHWKTATFTTWDEALAELAGGITVTVPCNTGTRRWGQHRLRLNPDGTITLLDHPDHVVDPEAEQLMLALGAPTNSCVAAAVYLPAHLPVPSRSRGAGDQPAGLEASGNALHVRVRALHTAVAWAQHPDTPWSPEWGKAMLRYGITPDLLAAWEADGWDRDDAALFLRTYSDPNVAKAWRDAGQCTQRAATLAGRGELPDEEARWSRVGFTKTTSTKWRKAGLSPEDAWEWESLRVNPSDLKTITNTGAHFGFTIADALPWVRAGIPARNVGHWYRDTNGDLAKAQELIACGVPMGANTVLQQWNTNHPNQIITPQVAGAYQRVGFDVRGNLQTVSRAMACGLTPERFARAVQALDPENPTPLWEALVAEYGHLPGWSGLFTTDAFGALRERVAGGWYPAVTASIVTWLHHHPSAHVA